MKKRFAYTLAAIATLSFAITGCNPENEPDPADIPVTEVKLNKASLALDEGAEELLIATISPEDATDKTVKWESDDTDTASVDGTGKVTAVAAGKATITVSAKDGSGKSDKCIVTVRDPSEPVVLVTSVTLGKETLELVEGGDETLLVTVAPDDATDSSLTWDSSNEDVATVDQNGKVIAITEGNAIITATANDGSEKSDECAVVVTAATVPVTSVELNKKTLTLVEGAEETLIATVAPDDATNRTVTWDSGNDAIATVDGNGKVTAIAPGQTTITVTANDGSGKFDECVITVEDDGIVARGDMSSSVFWKLHQDGTLTVFGEGNMSASFQNDTRFWYSRVNEVKKVVVEEGITNLGAFAFNNHPVLEEATIANSVTSMNYYAFYQCPVLAKVTFGSGVTGIGDYVFSECTSLKNVTLPDALTSIGTKAFSDCSNLETITIPRNVNALGTYIFSECNKLTAINVAAENTVLESVDGILFNEAKDILLLYPPSKTGTSYTIPSTVVEIRDAAFSKASKLTSVTIPESVATLGYQSFQYCSGLTSITIPASVVHIGHNSFQHCTGLTSVEILAQTWRTNYASGYPFYGIYLFDFCDNLKDMTLGATVPPTTGNGLFENFNTAACTLHVPAGTADAYRVADIWKDFGTITDQPPVAAPTQKPTITGPDGASPGVFTVWFLSSWGGAVTLTCSEVDGASTYKWTDRSGRVYQNTESRTFTVTAAEAYSVCGSNSGGDGPKSSSATVAN